MIYIQTPRWRQFRKTYFLSPPILRTMESSPRSRSARSTHVRMASRPSCNHPWPRSIWGFICEQLNLAFRLQFVNAKQKGNQELPPRTSIRPSVFVDISISNSKFFILVKFPSIEKICGAPHPFTPCFISRYLADPRDN